MQSLSHVRFLVANLAPDVAFYRDTIGWKQVVDVPGVYAEFDTGVSRLAFYRVDLMADVVAASGAAHGRDVVLCLRVADVDAEAARLRARGVSIVREPHDQKAWYQRVAHVIDAAGRIVELWSPLH